MGSDSGCSVGREKRDVTGEEIRQGLRCGQPTCRCQHGRHVHCPAHADRGPSLGVDDRSGKVLVVCRAGCRQGEVIAALQARGLWRPAPAHTPGRREAPLEAARREILAEARCQPWARQGVLYLYSVSDWLRTNRKRVAGLRAAVTEAGWSALAEAARMETLAEYVEMQLDTLTAERLIE